MLYITLSLAIIAVIICSIIFLPRLIKKKKPQGVKELRLVEYLSIYNKPVSPNIAVSLMMPIMLYLRDKHNQGEVFLKLSPSRILVKNDGCHIYETNGVPTDEFIAPEQRSGEFAGIKADIYGICALLRYILEYYYKSNIDQENVVNSATKALKEIISKGLDDEPLNRYNNMQELIFELANFNTGLTEEALAPFSSLMKQEGDRGTVINSKKTDKELKKGNRAPIIMFSFISFLICLSIGYFTLSYFAVLDYTKKHEFAMANEALNHIPYSFYFFPQESTFIKAGMYMDNREYDEAINELQILANYTGADELLLEVKYRKAAYSNMEGLKICSLLTKLLSDRLDKTEWSRKIMFVMSI